MSRIYSRLPGSLNARVLATYVNRQAITTPHWTVFGQLGYTCDRLSVTVENQYYSGGTIDNTKIDGQISAAGANINHVPSHALHRP